LIERQRESDDERADQHCAQNRSRVQAGIHSSRRPCRSRLIGGGVSSARQHLVTLAGAPACPSINGSAANLARVRRNAKVKLDNGARCRAVAKKSCPAITPPSSSCQRAAISWRCNREYEL